MVKYHRAKQERKFNAEIRAIEKDGKKTLTGLIPYDSASEDMGFIEIIKPGAFVKSINEMKRIFALWNHDDRQVLGNTENGTLKFTDTPAGLLAEVTLNDTTYAQDAWLQVQSGNVRTMSFGFSVLKEDYDYSGEKPVRFLIEVRLYEVSFGVPFPAYAETMSVAEVRSAYNKLTDDEKQVIKKLLEPIIDDEKKEQREEGISAESADNTIAEVNATKAIQSPDTLRKLALYEAKIKLYKEIDL